MIVEINSENFKEMTVQNEKPVLLDFYAEWCGPCKMLHPTIQKLSDELGDKVIIAKVNVENNKDIAASYGIMSIPTILILNKEEIVGGRMTGVRPYDDYYKALNDLL